MVFLKKYYKPWSLPWIIQQSVLVVKQGRMNKVSFKTLVTDYKSSRKVDKSMRQRSPGKADIKDGVKNFQFPAEIPENMTRHITCPGLDRAELSALNQFFDQVYVINLARRHDRRDAMIRKLTRLKIRAEFFPASDGADEENMREFADYFNDPIDPQNAHEMEVRLKRKVIVSPGAWGILRTYRNLLSEAKERGFDRILCLEDDVIFANDFEEMFRQFIKVIPESWKVLYLGASQHTWEENVDLVTPAGLFRETDPVRYYYPLNTDGAFAIGLRGNIIPFLLSETDGMKCPLDSGALRSAARRYNGECFVMKPNLVIADVSESDIRTGRKQKDFAAIARWDLSLYNFNQE